MYFMMIFSNFSKWNSYSPWSTKTYLQVMFISQLGLNSLTYYYHQVLKKCQN